MRERFRVLAAAPLRRGSRALEIGSGPHAISTVPLAHRVGRHGLVVAAERSRWTHFREVIDATGVGAAIAPVQCDARRLPFPDASFDLACCVHGVRSLGTDAEVIQVVREMLRVAGVVFVAESLPDAPTDAVRAHQAMYGLRSEVFEATTGRADDHPYRSLSGLVRLVEAAQGHVLDSKVLPMRLPHALAFFPRSWVERVPEATRRAELLARWDAADQLARRHGTDHPPVGVVIAGP